MIIILCGKSGSGKDALLKHLVARKCFLPIVSATTRPIRPNEVAGVDYDFISKETFQDMIDKDLFIEYRQYTTLVNNVPDVWYYGTHKGKFLNGGAYDYAGVLDLEGAEKFKEYCINNGVQVKILYIHTDDAIRKHRAIKRGGFDEFEWNRRLEDDAIKFSSENIAKVADNIIQNNYTMIEFYNQADRLIDTILNLNKAK